MNARRFNSEGLKVFADYVSGARVAFRQKQAVPPVPDQLLFDETLTLETPYVLPTGDVRFQTKADLGRFLTGIIPDRDYDEIRIDAGFWSWMAARYFDQITNGRQKIKEERAYVAGLTFQEFYRHLLLGPYYLYFTARDNPDRVKVLLYDEPTTMNEVMVQFGSYQTLMQNRALQEVIQRLYFDEQRGKIKRGAGGKGAGTPRRLMDFFRQIELNYDLAGISTDRFWMMLPKEFTKFQ